MDGTNDNLRVFGPARSLETVLFIGAPDAWGDLPHQVGHFTSALILELTTRPDAGEIIAGAITDHGGAAHLVLHDPPDVQALRWAAEHSSRVRSMMIVPDRFEPAMVMSELQARVTVD